MSNAISQLFFHWFWWNLMSRCVIATATSIPGLCIHRGMTPQNGSISFYSSPQNSEKSANNRLYAKPVKYSNFYDILAKVSPILMKCCLMMTHISYPKHNSCSKSQIYKNSWWWRLAFKKNDKCWISEIVCLILIKFGTVVHNSHHNVNSRSVH